MTSPYLNRTARTREQALADIERAEMRRMRAMVSAMATPPACGQCDRRRGVTVGSATSGRFDADQGLERDDERDVGS